MSPLQRNSNERIGDKEDEEEVVFETAQGETTETASKEKTDAKHMTSLDSREARKRRKSKKRGERKSPENMDKETLSSLSNSLHKEHFSQIEGHFGRYDSLITAKRLKLQNSRQLQSLETRFQILQRNEQ